MRKQIVMIWIIAFVLLGWGSLLYCFFLSHPEYFPRCPVKYITGFNCPSCGNQRAICALIHGNISEALIMNPFMWFTILYFILYIIIMRNQEKDRILTILSYTYVILYIAWGVVRNVIGL